MGIKVIICSMSVIKCQSVLPWGRAASILLRLAPRGFRVNTLYDYISSLILLGTSSTV